MKKFASAGLILLFCFFGAMISAKAQEAPKKSTKKEIKVKKKTVMEQYEPEMILSVDDRVRLKEERIALIKKRREIIDTLDISDRRRRRLLKELYRSPFSDKWERVVADIEFEDNEEY